MLKQKVIKGSFWSLIGSVGYQVFNLIIFIILSRLLEVDDFGTVALAMVFVEFMVIISRFGILEALIQSPKMDNRILSSAFWGTAMFGMLSMMVLFVCATPVANWIENDVLTPLILSLAIIPFLTGISTVPEAMLQRDHNFKSLTLRTLIATTASGVVGVLCVMLGYGLYSLVFQRLVSELLKVILLWKYAQCKPSFCFSWSDFKALFSLGFPLALTSIINGLSNKFSEFMIGYVLGTTALGYVKIASKLFDFIVQIALAPVVNVGLTTFSRVSDQQERLQKYYQKFVQLSCLVAIPAFFGLASIAPEGVVVVFDEKWLPCVPLLQLLCLSGAAVAFNYYYVPLLTSVAMGRTVLITSFVAVTLGTMVLLFTVQISLEAVYVGSLVVTYVMTGVYIRLISSSLNLPILSVLKVAIPPLMSAVVMGVAVWYVRPLLSEELLLVEKMLVLIGVGVVSYITVLCTLFYRYTFALKSDIKNILSKRSEM